MPDTSRAQPTQPMRQQALRLERLGAYDRAEALLSQVLAMTESLLGAEHPELADPLNDLARCRFNGGLLSAALADYERLLRLLVAVADDPRIDIVRHQIRRCRSDLRQRDASAGLQAGMALMVRQACSQRAVGETESQQRLRHVARRLLARGRVDAGVRLLQCWLDQVLQTHRPISKEALTDLRDHGIALWNGGRPLAAVPVLRAVVIARQRHQPAEPATLARALRDWGQCLAAAGQARSARETLALADSLAAAPVDPSPGSRP